MTNTNVIAVHEAKEAGEDIVHVHGLEHETPALISEDPGTNDDGANLHTDDEGDDKQQEQGDDEVDDIEEEQGDDVVDDIEEDEELMIPGHEDILVLPSHNPYAQTHSVRSPDGTLIQQRPSASKPAVISAPDWQHVTDVPAVQTQPTDKSSPEHSNQSTNVTGALHSTSAQQPTTLSQPSFQGQPGRNVTERAPYFNTSLSGEHAHRKPITQEQGTKQDTHASEEPAMQHEQLSKRTESIPEPALSQSSNVSASAPRRDPLLQPEPAPQEELVSRQQTEPVLQRESTPQTGLNASHYQVDNVLVATNATDTATQEQNLTTGLPEGKLGTELVETEHKQQVKKRLSDRIKKIQDRIKLEVEQHVRAGMTGEEVRIHQAFISDVLENGIPSNRPPPNGPSISLHPVIRMDNLTTSQFEFRCVAPCSTCPTFCQRVSSLVQVG